MNVNAATRQRMRTLGLSLALALLAMACAEPHESSEARTNKENPDTPETPKAPPDAPPSESKPKEDPTGEAKLDKGETPDPKDCSEETDFFRLELPKEARKCEDRGKVYNYQEKTCTAMAQAPFKCTYENAVAKIVQMQHLPDILTKYKEAGRQLIACGVSKDGTSFYGQVWIPDAKKKSGCLYHERGDIMNVCVSNVGGVPPKGMDMLTYARLTCALE